MRKWLLLSVAVVTEVTGSLSLKAALDHSGWYILTAAGYITAFAVLSLVLRAGMPLGVAYGVWGASGVALTAVASALLFDEVLTGAMIVGLVLIILGVLCIELGSQLAEKKKAARL